MDPFTPFQMKDLPQVLQALMAVVQAHLAWHKFVEYYIFAPVIVGILTTTIYAIFQNIGIHKTIKNGQTTIITQLEEKIKDLEKKLREK